MILKKLPQAGHFAWSNSKKNSYLFATGTLRTPEDTLLNLDQENFLQIFNLDTGDKTDHLNLLGKTKCDTSFSSLSWDNFGEDSQYPYGIIVGGLSDGSITIWDPNDIVTDWKKQGNPQNIETNLGCICYEQQLFAGSVNALEFNPFKPNLIASGGASEVLIMNIERNISQPEIFSPGTPNYHEGSIISSVSWNKKVQHILASASLNGLTVVWDLKTNKPIFNFKDNSIAQNRNVSLAWNPEIPTQIAASYDDEKNCELQIWDLRNPQGPVVLFGHGHSKGINCVNWCTNDASLILTGGRDDKIICWNYKTSEIVSETTNGENICNVKWSPKLPSIFSVTGQSGNVTINTLSSEEVTSYAPKWYKRPIFSHFGPKDLLLEFNEGKPSIINEFNVRKKEDDISKKLVEFEKRLFEFEDNHDINKYLGQILANNDLSKEDRIFWDFARMLSLEKNQLPSKLIELLGFSKNSIIKNSEDYTGKTHRKKDETSPKTSSQSTTKAPRNNNYDFTLMSSKDAEGFFDQLSLVSHAQPLEVKSGSFEKRKDSTDTDMVLFNESISKNVNWDASIEKIIKQNVLIGNYEGAVDCALKCGRSAEALLLAYSHSTELFEATTNAFFVASKDTFIKNVFKYIVEKENKEIAKTYDVKNWREVAALSITSKKREEFPEIMSILGQRLLEEKGQEDEALLCFLLSQNMEKIVEIFQKKLSKLPKSNLRKTFIISTVEKILILLNLIHKSNLKRKIDWNNFILEFSDIALQYRFPSLSFRILTLGSEENKRISYLKDYLYHSNEEMQINFVPPPLPYRIENVGIKTKAKSLEKKTEKKPAGSDYPSSKSQSTREMNPPNRPANFFTPSPVVSSTATPAKNESRPGPPPPERKIFTPPVSFNPAKNTSATPIESESNLEHPSSFTNVTKSVGVPPPPHPKPPVFQPPSGPSLQSEPVLHDHVKPAVPPPPVKKAVDFPKPSIPPSYSQPQISEIPPAKIVPPRPQPPSVVKPINPVPLTQPQPVLQKVERKVELSGNSNYIVDSVGRAKNVLGIIEPNMRKKMELEKSLDILINMVNEDSLKPLTYTWVLKLLQCWEGGNIDEALKVHGSISEKDWDANKDWLKTMKRVLVRK